MKTWCFVVAFLTALVVLPGMAKAQELSAGTARALAELRSGAEVLQVRPAGDGRSIRFMRGRLTLPSTRPAGQIVRDLLARRGALFNVYDVDDLVVRRELNLGASRVIRLGQTVNGVPVVGADLTALLDRNGQVRWVIQSLAEPVVS